MKKAIRRVAAYKESDPRVEEERKRFNRLSNRLFELKGGI